MREGRREADSTGVLWYSEGQWPRLRALSADASDLEETHAEWLSVARAMVARLRAAGENVVRVDADLDDIVAWCRAHGLPLDGESRSRYAVEKMREAAEAGKPLPELTDEDLR